MSHKNLITSIIYDKCDSDTLFNSIISESILEKLDTMKRNTAKDFITSAKPQESGLVERLLQSISESEIVVNEELLNESPMSRASMSHIEVRPHGANLALHIIDVNGHARRVYTVIGKRPVNHNALREKARRMAGNLSRRLGIPHRMRF